MKKLFFVIMLISFAIIGKAQTIEQGIMQMENENFAAALNTFNSVCKADPKACLAYYYIGEVNYLMENYDEAEKSYKKGLVVNSQCAECYIGLGKLQLDNGNVTEAEKYFSSALKSNKKSAAIPALIGDAYLFSKKPDAVKAVHYLSQARDMDPKVGKYWAHLGDAYMMSGNNGEAMTAYESAVEKNPSNAEAYISMARIWANAKQMDLAIPKLEEAIRLSPNDARPIKDLYELYIQNHDYDKVTPLLEKYVALTGSDVDAKVRLVKFLTFQAKDYERANIEGEKLLLTNPDQYTLHRWMAWSHFELGHYQESYDHSEKLFDAIAKKADRKAFPSDYEYWAKAALQLGKLEEASHIYRKYLEIVPERANEIYGLLAKTYFDSANYVQSIAYYKRKGDVKALNNADEYWLGWAYFYINKYTEADSAFATVLLTTPDYPNGWLMRAKIAQRIDSGETKLFLAKDFYENYITYAIKDTAKYKQNLINAANYLAYYWSQQVDKKTTETYYEEKLSMTFTGKTWEDYCNSKAIEYYELSLSLNPNDKDIEFNLKILKEKH